MKQPFFRKLVRECLNEWVTHQKSTVKWDDLSRSVKNDITENIYSNNNYIKNAYWSPESLRDGIDDVLIQPVFEVGQGDVDELYNQLTQIGWGIYEKNVGFLMKVIKSGKSLDPVILNNNKFFDGGHRLTAYKRLRKKTIPTIDIGFLLDFDWESWDNGKKEFLDKEINESSEKIMLKETLLPEEYHATSLFNIIDILKTNTINLSAGFASQADNKSQKPFFLSLSRTKSPKLSYGQKHTKTLKGKAPYRGFGRIVFDGRKLNNNFKSMPVDYWQTQGKGDSFEYEDRIITDKPYIKNIRNYILSIEIMTVYHSSEIDSISKILNLGKQYSIPVYVYDNINDMVKKTNTVNHKIKETNKKSDEDDDSTRDVDYKIFIAILLYDYNKYIKDVNGYDIFKNDINEFIKKHNIAIDDIYKVYDTMRSMSHFSYRDYITGLAYEIQNFFKSGSHGPFREHVQLLIKDMRTYGAKNLSDYFKVKIEGKKPTSEKKDYTNSFKIKRLIGDTYKDVGHEKLDSTYFYINTYNYGGSFDDNDFGVYLTQRDKNGTLSDFVNYLLNKYTFEKVVSMIYNGGYNNTTNTSEYKLEKTGRNV